MKFLQLTIWLMLIGYNLSAAPEKKLVILQTTDIHCHINDEEDSWLKLATIIRHERLLAGRDNVLLIDCGDTVAGTFTATGTRGGIAVKILNALQYDVWIPGNHDYDFGIAALLKYHRDFSGRMLAANLQLTGHDRKPLAGWKIFNRNGIKIAVIGLSLPDSEKNYWRDNTFTVISGLDVMPQVMNEINRHQPDIIILAAHCGLYSANKMMLKLARWYPEIKLLLGGHTHRNVPGEKIGSNGWYVQAGKHASGIAKISIKFNSQSRRVTEIKSYIIPITKTTPVDQQCLTAVNNKLNKITKLGQQELGSTTTVISASTKFGTLSTAAALNGQAIAVAAKTEIAFIGAKYNVSIPAGKINRKQAFALYPYQDTVSTLMLTADETKAIIEEQAERGTRYHWLTPIGLHFEINRQGKVVGKLRFTDGTSWEANAPRLKIAFSSYDLAGIYGRKFQLLHKLSLAPECRGLNTGIKIYQAVADYIQQHSPL